MSKRDPTPSAEPADEFRHRQPPKDSLDFKLSAIYDHHTALFWSKNQMVCQRETVNFRKRKRRNSETHLKLNQEQEKSIRVWVDPKRNTYYYLT